MDPDNPPLEYSQRRYLASKRTVDDRALNKDVLARLRAELASDGKARHRVLEIGAGLGTMVARLVDWGVLRKGDYVLLDDDAETLEDARQWLWAWAAAKGLEVVPEGNSIALRSDRIDITLSFERKEIGDYLASAPGASLADLLVANAFLDLVDVAAVLPPLLRLGAARALYWFSINYDGETIFQPDHPDDASFMHVYNRSMDERVRHGRASGDSRTGRHLFGRLAEAGASVLAAGSSDWIVHPASGRYEGDEAYFLHHIIRTVDEELARHPEIERAALRRWIELRHQQIDEGKLVYLAHQLDFAGRCRT